MRHPCIYRVYDANDRLIYIGASGDLVQRFELHKRNTWWFELASRVEWEDQPSRAAAFAAEALAIQEEQPAFNIHGTGREYGDFSHLTAEDRRVCREWRERDELGRVPFSLMDHLRLTAASDAA
jgi:excinuclease UvrABC nuclease subunit